MRKLLTRRRRRYVLACAVVGASLGVMGAQCQPPKPPPPAPASLSISPGGHDFPTQPADGGGRGSTFHVTNNGSETTSLAMSLEGGDPSQFELFNPLAPPAPDGPCVKLTTLDPAQTCVQHVFFLPTKAGSHSTTMVAAGDPGGRASVPLTGNATALVVEPSSIGTSFPDETADGTSTRTHVVTVTNNGPVATSLVVALQGGDPSQFDLVRPAPAGDCVYLSQLGPGESCPQTILFNPTKVGLARTTLVVTGHPGGIDTHSLEGTGV
jgi:hypothetical protein